MLQNEGDRSIHVRQGADRRIRLQNRFRRLVAPKIVNQNVEADASAREADFPAVTDLTHLLGGKLVGVKAIRIPAAGRRFHDARISHYRGGKAVFRGFPSL